MSHLPVSPVLDALPLLARSHLLKRSVLRRLVGGERLYLAGDRVHRVHLVCAGVVKMTAQDADGRETILFLGLAGEVIGDLAALDGYAQPLDAVAAMRTTVVGFDAEAFVEVLGDNPVAALELARAQAQRTRWIVDTALERTGSEVPARLAGRLLDLADLVGCVRNGAVELDVSLPQADLAKLAGMCRESANRALKTFREAGVVDYRDRRLRILRPDALERIRCEGRRRAPLGDPG